MEYLYITLNKSASQYAISLDEIFLTLYGFTKKKNIVSSHRRFRKESYESAAISSNKEIPGTVYRISVSERQHDMVRDILCDFLMEDHKYRNSIHKYGKEFTSAEFVEYILEKAEIIDFADSANGIAKEDLMGLSQIDNVDVIYEGDLKKYVEAKKQDKNSDNSNIRHLHSIKKNRKPINHGIGRYEYVPNQMQEVVTAD